MIRMILRGKTFEIKEELKHDKFRWNPELKGWYKDFPDEDDKYVLNLSDAFEADGRIAVECKKFTPKTEGQVKKYPVKESWIFNLESMHDKLYCLEYDVQEGKLQFPFTVAGKEIKDFDDLDALRDECDELEYKAKSGTVMGKDYGRIKEIVAWRVEARYVTCLANGMDEAKAGQCFEDM